jgi:glycosyltransferase involved in cell wall biosynthesis
VTDLLAMLRQVGRATGIQRVQLGLCQHLLEHDAPRCRFVALDAPLDPLWTLDGRDLRALIRYALEEPHDLPRARALVDAALDRAAWTHLPSARLFFVMGAFWFFAGATALLDRLREAGLRLGILAYDLIPLTHPEHTGAATVAAFRQALAEGATRWDFALAISEHTAAELRTALNNAIPVRAVPLAHRFTDAEAGRWPEALRDLEGRDYVLCVGTIESRKNHLALFQAWKLLLAEGAAPPPLVLVGRPGWRVDDLMAQLEATRCLDGRIRLVHGISDPELAALYRGCRFSVFPSFTEGWGLPVGESLAFGKLCLASTEGATPEAGAGFAEPLDPFSPRQIAGQVRRFLDDRAALAAEARIAAGFRPRSWSDCAAGFTTRLEECLALPPAPSPPPAAPLTPGQRPDLAPLLGPGFAPPEDGIAWMTGRTATLRLATEGPARALLHLAVREGGRLAVSVDDGPPRWHGLRPGPDARALVELPGGAARITLHGATGCGVGVLSLLPPHAAPLPPRQPVRFGGAGDPLAWAPLAESGFDLSGSGAGLAVLDAEAVLRLPITMPALRLLLLVEGDGMAIHPGGETELAAATILALEAPAGELRLTLRARGPLRLHALQWAAEDDLDGRLALLECAAPFGATLAQRLDALEAPAAAPLPGGEVGQVALRLGAG